MGADVVAERAAVAGELRLREDFWPAHQLAVHARALAALACAVLHGLHLHVVPVLPERADDAAVMGHVAVPVGRALPDAHGGEVWRLERGHVPLVDAVVGNAVESDLAVRPGLHAGPFDAVVEILGLARREVVDESRRTSGAAGIHAHAGIVVRHPFLRIDNFPALVEIAGAGGHVGVPLSHALPRARIAVLEGEALAVRTVAEDHGIASVLYRTEHVGAQEEAVVHRDRHVPVDAHTVAHFTAVPVGLPARRPLVRVLDRSHRVPPVESPSRRPFRPPGGPTTMERVFRTADILW